MLDSGDYADDTMRSPAVSQEIAHHYENSSPHRREINSRNRLLVAIIGEYH
jgi:hypothetical protein